MKEENEELLKKLGKVNPFKVPDGYFENFSSDLMDKLPEKDIPIQRPITTWMRIKPWVYMAAIFVGAAFIMRILQFTQKGDTKNIQSSTPSTEISQDKYIDETVENSRLDGYQLYQFLSDAQDKSENY